MVVTRALRFTTPIPNSERTNSLFASTWWVSTSNARVRGYRIADFDWARYSAAAWTELI